MTRFSKTRRRSDRRTARRLPLPPDLALDLEDAAAARTATIAEIAAIYKQRQAELNGSSAPRPVKEARRLELAIQHDRAFRTSWALYRQRERELQAETQARARKAA